MSNELTHYGVLGMKWGVRKDGRSQGYHETGNGINKNNSNMPSTNTKQRLKTTAKVAGTVLGITAAAFVGVTTAQLLKDPFIRKEVVRGAKTIASLGLEKFNSASDYIKTEAKWYKRGVRPYIRIGNKWVAPLGRNKWDPKSFGYKRRKKRLDKIIDDSINNMKVERIKPDLLNPDLLKLNY